MNGARLMSPVNNDTLAQLRAWKRVTSRSGLWVWHYMGNIDFPIAPYPYYEALGDGSVSLPAAPAPFADWVRWERERASSPRTQEAREHWAQAAPPSVRPAALYQSGPRLVWTRCDCR